VEVAVSESDEDVRVAIHRTFAATGRPPEDLPGDALQRLADARHVVLDGDGAIVMAHPFATIPLGFAVMGGTTLWWGGCAWDSFAIPHLVPHEPTVLVATTCLACGRAHAWVVDTDAPPAGDEVAHFLVPVARIWDDVVHTCANQRLFCDRGCVDDWLARTGHDRGYVMDLPTLWRLARGWYAGRLEHGYTRRDPSTAAAYFADVGLRGPFWGLHG
jgi:hypothetical protein